MMNFPKAPEQYDEQHQDQVQREILLEDAKNIKTDTVQPSFKMRDTSTGLIKTVVITAGAFVIT